MDAGHHWRECAERRQGGSARTASAQRSACTCTVYMYIVPYPTRAQASHQLWEWWPGRPEQQRCPARRATHYAAFEPFGCLIAAKRKVPCPTKRNGPNKAS
eukprot:scaffold1086_cov397-Prasinococcus_capsulatus_cf.AAC.9